MFGFSWGEIFLLLLVGMLVVGPKNLPSMMRTAGQWIAKLRRMSSDLRSQSGIDELIRIEGLEREVAELRSLARLNLVDTIMAPAIQAANAATSPRPSPITPSPSATPASTALPDAAPPAPTSIAREREYPTIGCDAYDVLPDDMTDKPPADAADAKAEEATKVDEPAKDEAAKIEEPAKDEGAKADEVSKADEAAKDDAPVTNDAKNDEPAKVASDATIASDDATATRDEPAAASPEAAKAPEMTT